MFLSRVTLTYTKDLTKPKIIIPKSLKIFYLTSQLCFGIDFGFTKELHYKKYGQLVKYLAKLHSFSIFIILLVPLYYHYDQLWPWLNFFEFTAILLVLNITKYTVFDFLVDIYMGLTMILI